MVDGWVEVVSEDGSDASVLWMRGICRVGSAGVLLDLAMNDAMSLMVSPLGSLPLRGRSITLDLRSITAA